MTSTGHSHVTYSTREVGIHKEIYAGLRCSAELPIGVIHQTSGLILPPLKIFVQASHFLGAVRFFTEVRPLFTF